MRTSFARFVNDESGATAIEYGLIAAGIAVAILTAVNAVGGSLTVLFNDIAGKLGGGGGGGGAG
jgi:pilus assembly protein Flp/PilA